MSEILQAGRPAAECRFSCHKHLQVKRHFCKGRFPACGACRLKRFGNVYKLTFIAVMHQKGAGAEDFIFRPRRRSSCICLFFRQHDVPPQDFCSVRIIYAE
jgi:hypothetical protein